MLRAVLERGVVVPQAVTPLECTGQASGGRGVASPWQSLLVPGAMTS